MNWLAIAVATVTAAVIGVFFDWLLKPLFPARPQAKHVAAGILFCIVFVVIAVYTQATAQNHPDGETSGAAAAATLNAGQAAATGTALACIPGDLTDGKVLRSLFPGFDPVEGTWNPSPQDLALYQYAGTSGPLTAKVALNEMYDASPYDRYAFVIIALHSKDPLYCPRCGANLAGSVFARIKDCWTLISFQPFIDQLGERGVAPPMELVQIGKTNVGVLMHPMTSQMVIAEDIVLVALVRNQITVVLHERKSIEGRACLNDCLYHIDSQYHFVDGQNLEYYDFVITTTGTEPDQNQHSVTINETRVFKFSDESGRYVAGP